MIHSTLTGGYDGTLDDLAIEIGNLRYDALAMFLKSLAAKLATDADADAGRGRPKLAEELRRGAEGVGKAATRIEKAWAISAPRMEMEK